MLRTNINNVVMGSVVGRIRNSMCPGWRVTQAGKAFMGMSIGGICYNVKIGDSAYGWAGDHVEPGVTIFNADKGDSDALNMLSCIGNRATVISGDGKGKTGYVTGKHGGVEDVMIHFDEETLSLLNPGDNIRVNVYGQGLELLDYPDIHLMSIDPELLLSLPISENNDGTMTIDVTAKIPSFLMGSGVGSNNPYSGDYDLMTFDKEKLEKYNLKDICLGDIVLLEDCDNEYGRGYLEGSVVIGVVVHSDCVISGHGPGIATIMSCKRPIIKGNITSNANIKNYIFNKLK